MAGSHEFPEDRLRANTQVETRMEEFEAGKM
jgi:hypothetical protein